MSKNSKNKILINAFISTVSVSISSFSALFVLQNPQILKYCYPGLAVVFGISSLGIATSFTNLKRIILPNRQEQNFDDRREAPELIEPVKMLETETVITEENNQTLDPNFIKTWKESTHDEKIDLVSSELFSPVKQHNNFAQFTHKRK